MRQAISVQESQGLTDAQRRALTEWAVSHEYVNGDGIYLPTIGQMLHFISEHHEPIQLQNDGESAWWEMRTAIYHGEWAGRESGLGSPVTPLWWYVRYILDRDVRS